MIKTTTGLQAFSQKLVFWKKIYFTKMTRTPPISGQYEPLNSDEITVTKLTPHSAVVSM